MKHNGSNIKYLIPNKKIITNHDNHENLRSCYLLLYTGIFTS
jgi:hypothetical protein